MPRILHIMPLEKFAKAFVSFIDRYYNNKHDIWLYDIGFKMEEQLFHYLTVASNVRIFHNSSDIFKNKQVHYEMKKYTKIIVHWAHNCELCNYFFYHPLMLRRLYIYFWGGDIALPPEGKKFPLQKYIMVKFAKGIITIKPQEFKTVEKEYGRLMGKHFSAMYTGESIEREETNVHKNHGNVINIQVGNSATEENNHIEILNILEKYKNDNIRLYIPLSYGSEEYGNQVQQYAKKVFGEKCVILSDFMPIEEYYKLLQEMDIAIFGMYRQQALGNIYNALKRGTKVFLKDKGILNTILRDEGFIVYTIESINELDIQELCYYSQDIRKINKNNYKKIYNIENILKGWNCIFDS